MRALQVGRALQRMGHVTVLVVSSAADDHDAMAATVQEFDVLPPILPERVPMRLGDRLRRCFARRYMNLSGYMASAAHQAWVDAVRTEFDMCWVLNARTPNLLNTWLWPNSHLDVDDIPSTYQRTVAQNAFSLSERLRARILRRLLYRHERQLSHRFTTLSVCSAPDREYLGDTERIHVIPNGFERPSRAPARRIDPAAPRIGFIGLFSYLPNLDGVQWFLAQCWPLIKAAVPSIRLRLVGKDSDGPLKPANPDVDALGWIADPAHEISTWSTMIVPIRFGGGTRVKIADAFSRKCPAVATTLGAFGYEVAHGKQLIIADRAADFARACVELVLKPEQAAAIAERAWTDFLDKWTWDAIIPKVCSAAEDCLRRSTPVASSMESKPRLTPK
jgi:glycosyltransferase involved in cell wall biosynthesis